MSLEEKKEILVQIIEDADEKLLRLMTAVANEYNNTANQYTPEEIENFSEIRDQILSDPGSSYSPAQANDLIRNKERNEI